MFSQDCFYRRAIKPHLSSTEKDEKAEARPGNGSGHQDRPGATKLLNQILQEVKTARREINRAAKTGPGFFKRLAQVLDIVFFLLYLTAVVIFLLYMYIVWLHEGTSENYRY